MAKVNPVPQDRSAFGVYLTVKGGAEAIDFYKRAFGAEEVMRLSAADGKVGHADLKIGNTYFMLADEFPEYGNKGPITLGGSPVMLHLYVEDVDGFVKRAVDAGAELLEPVADQFYGDRGGRVRDPFGHTWWFASQVEDVSEDEMRRRARKLYGMS
jgi:PhnB protein